MKTIFKSIIAAIASFSVLSSDAFAQDDCFSILAGKMCTSDGSVMLSHNEDDSGEQMLNVYKVPSDKSLGTSSFIWTEFPGLSVADSFMNEWGVCICSDACGSREDKDSGEILYQIRTDVAKYAHSSREAARLIGRNVEARGYKDSGRSYLVADPDEGWIVSVVRGHHWVAMRVPDDKVLVIPNCYVIDRVDLSDTLNFMGSADLVSYAQERGWYDPAKDGDFSFRKAYARPNTIASDHNTSRHKAVLGQLTDGTYDYDPYTVEACITPSHKLSVEDMIDALSLHGEDRPDGRHPQNVCLDRTVVSLVFQLRSWMPRDVGCLMWMCPGHPCLDVYLPVYLGIGSLPADFGRFSTASEAFEKHFSDSKDLKKNYPDGFYWKHLDAWNRLSADYAAQIEKCHALKSARQKQIFESQTSFERKILRMTPERAAVKMSGRLAAECE